MTKKKAGIVTGNRARKKAGLRHKVTEGYDQAAKAHIKRKAAQRKKSESRAKKRK